MDFEKMYYVTNKMFTVKPSKYVFAFCSVAWTLTCFAAYLPRQHQAQEKGGFAIKLSIEAVEAFKECFPEGEAPEVKIK